MMFQGRSVISAVWGVVPAEADRSPSLPVWARLRLFRRRPRQQQASPRLPVPSSNPGAGPQNP
jgi:hypothetical protein